MAVIIFPLLWIVMIAAGMKFNKKPSADAPLSKDQTLALRGICAIEILLGHLSIYTGSTVLYPLRKADIMFVGLFFLMSGYGTALSNDKKKDYLRGFVGKKLVRLFVPAYMAFVVNNIQLYINFRNNQFFRELLEPEFFIDSINWFIFELMALYLITYVCMKIGSLKKTHIIIWIAALIFLVSACIYKLDDPWYGCTLCYPLGITYYVHKEKFDEIVFRKKPIFAGLVIVMLLGIFTVSYILLNEEFVIAGIIARNLASLCFCLLVMLVLTYFTFVNRISRWLGDCSFEIYLYHIPVIGIAVHYIENEWLCCLVSIVGSIILACFFRLLWAICFAPITSKREQKSKES